MKKMLFIPILSFFLYSCQGEMGPPGRDGQDGEATIGHIFEVDVDFDYNQNTGFWEYVTPFPNNIEVFETDIVVVYVLSGITNEGDAIWEPLPQTLFFDDGNLLYGFNHTYFDIMFFIDGEGFLGNLEQSLTQGFTYRVAILPADYAKNMDLNNIENILNTIENKEVLKMN